MTAVKRHEVQQDIEKHIRNVQYLLEKVKHALVTRQKTHDASKLTSAELPVYAECAPRLKELSFGSAEYKHVLSVMKPALDHHYAFNRHHPEHFKDGVCGMTLIDLVEMICDWKASAVRDGQDVQDSITFCARRFGLTPQLALILRNTVTALED